MANVLFKLSHYFDDQQYYDLVSRMMAQEVENVRKQGIWHSNWASVQGLITNHVTEVAIMGNDALSVSSEMQKNYLPLSLFLGGMNENLPLLQNKKTNGNTMIFVCKNKTCNLPVEDPQVALEQIRTYKNLIQYNN